jgi:hypothetical protein
MISFVFIPHPRCSFALSPSLLLFLYYSLSSWFPYFIFSPFIVVFIAHTFCSFALSSSFIIFLCLSLILAIPTLYLLPSFNFIVIPHPLYAIALPPSLLLFL